MASGRPATEDPGDKSRTDRLARLEETATQNRERLTRIEQHLKTGTGRCAHAAKPDSRIRPDSPAVKIASEEELYNRAKLAFDQGNTAAARKGFEELLQQYPNSQSADNAQFWIGETFFREKAYEKSILEYQKVIEKYPKGNKLPSSLLKQGMAFMSLGDKVNSRLIFEELVRKHPQYPRGQGCVGQNEGNSLMSRGGRRGGVRRGGPPRPPDD